MPGPLVFPASNMEHSPFFPARHRHNCMTLVPSHKQLRGSAHFRAKKHPPTEKFLFWMDMKKKTGFRTRIIYSHGIYVFDGRTKTIQVIQGTKMKFSGNNYHWEKGKFLFSVGLNRWTLVKGVKCVNGKKKKRGNWRYDAREGKVVVKRLKGVQKCGDSKCSRKSSNSKNMFKCCGKCARETTFYCSRSRKHQKRDWKVHKFECFFY